MNRRKRLLILGNSGMLGHEMLKYFLGKEEYEVFTTSRNKELSEKNGSIYFDALTTSLDCLPADVDYVINCIGIIKPYIKEHEKEAILINAYFPWKLAEWSKENGIRMIHISTDCVYSGREGNYKESSPHDALDMYGKTKSLGECESKAMILRTSIIGEETSHFVSLLEWAKKEAGKRVQGYTNHIWNGLTTQEYAKCCEKIIHNDWYAEGVYHIYAKDDVTKYTMLHYFNDKFQLNLTIESAAPFYCNRTLRSEKDLCRKLSIPSVEEMIMEMK